MIVLKGQYMCLKKQKIFDFPKYIKIKNFYINLNVETILNSNVIIIS